MELVAWSIAVLIALFAVHLVFIVLCGIAAEEKGRTWWWAIMGLFNIFGLIVVLLLDRTVASEVDRMTAIERAREPRDAPTARRATIASREAPSSRLLNYGW